MKLLIGVGALVLLAGSASAASAQDAMNWTGFYAGLGLAKQHTTVTTVGNGNSSTVAIVDDPLTNTDLSDEDLFGSDTFSIESLAPSLIAGYGKELDNHLYVGIEGEADFLDTARADAFEAFGDPDPDCSTVQFCVEGSNFVSLQTLGRLRAVVGFAASPNVLLFGTAGIVVAKGTYGLSAYAQAPGDQDSDEDSTSAYLVGATVGAGIDIKATKNLIVRVEGAYDTYPTAIHSGNLSASAVAAGGGGSSSLSDTANGSAKFADQMIRAALIWQF
jgi:opacity protein-like surface antigen